MMPVILLTVPTYNLFWKTSSFLIDPAQQQKIRNSLQGDRARSAAMSRHSTSFQAEARVPAEVVAELLPQPIPGKSDSESAASATPARRSYKNRVRRLVMATSAVALLAASAWYGWDYWTVGRFLVSTDDAYVKADNTTIAPKVSGYLADVLVGDNERVKAGQVLARIDDRDFKVALDQAKADVAAAQAAIASKQAQLDVQEAIIGAAKATIEVDIAT